MARTCWLTDIVPTLCYLNQWPVPAETEGSVLYQALDFPDKHALTGPCPRPAAEGAEKEQLERIQQSHEKPLSKGIKGEGQSDESEHETGRKKLANDRLKKLGYDLPF
jgi:hypothetical protein